MSDLDNTHRIDSALLDGNHYFASLLAQGVCCGLLEDCDIEQIQRDSMVLLADQTEKYTRGQSSSIRIEKAKDLLGSVFYSIGIALKGYSSPDDAIRALKIESLEALYRIGQKKILQKLQMSRLLHRCIQNNLFETKNVFYRSTVVDGINGFFKLYRPEFAAQEIHITADYPVFFCVTDLSGIEFIEAYLQNIAYENEFCRYFSPDVVDHLLCGLDGNYHQILMNLYEPILMASLCCVLIEQPVEKLCSNMARIKKMLSEKNTREMECMFLDAADALVRQFVIPCGLQKYIRRSIPKIAASAKRAICLGALEAVVLTPRYPEDAPQIFLSYGERMSDQAYTEVLEKLIWCDRAAVKAEMILNEIHSFGDLLEILCDAAPTRAELLEMFWRFPIEVIAALMVQYPSEDFLTDEREVNIVSALNEFCSALSPQSRAQLEAVVQTIKMQ